MNKHLKLLLVAIFVCFNAIAFASNTGGEDKKSPDDSSVAQQQGDKKRSMEKLDLEESSEDIEDAETQNVDSTEDDSVSKYNFIFYFLYKFKYNEEASLSVF